MNIDTLQQQTSLRKNFPEYVGKFIPDECSYTYNKNYLRGIKFTIIGIICRYANEIIYLIQNTETIEVYLLGERGLELI